MNETSAVPHLPDHFTISFGLKGKWIWFKLNFSNDILGGRQALRSNPQPIRASVPGFSLQSLPQCTFTIDNFFPLQI